jgi:trimeric autotransporter adhesin
VPLFVKVNNQLSGVISAFNTSWGFATLINNTGNDNTAVGNIALKDNTTGSQNVAVGDGALASNTTATNNTAIGHQALFSNTTGLDNMASGSKSLISNTTGSRNNSYGNFSLFGNTTGGSNATFGDFSMVNNTTGQFNTAMGTSAMSTNINGNNNTTIGAFSNVGSLDLNNATAIGFNASVDASNKVRIGNSAVTVIEGQVPFTTPSDGRFKYNVQEDVKGLDFILQLRPVTYQFDVKQFDAQLNTKTGSNHTGQDDNLIQASYTAASAIRRTGFIAQEVEQASVKSGYNFSGISKPQTPEGHYGLSYESFVVPLVKAVQEQQQLITELKKEVAALTAGIKQLQKEINNNRNKNFLVK